MEKEFKRVYFEKGTLDRIKKVTRPAGGVEFIVNATYRALDKAEKKVEK